MFILTPTRERFICRSRCLIIAAVQRDIHDTFACDAPPAAFVSSLPSPPSAPTLTFRLFSPPRVSPLCCCCTFHRWPLPARLPRFRFRASVLATFARDVRLIPEMPFSRDARAAGARSMPRFRRCREVFRVAPWRARAC